MIEETGTFFSRQPSYSISDTPENSEPILGAYDYDQVDPTPGQGMVQDSSFLAPPVQGDVMHAKPAPSLWQQLTTPTVKGNPGSIPLVTALHGLANIIPSARPIVAANQAIFNQQYEQAQQQELVEQRKKQAERQALHEGLQAINQATKIPAGSLRKAYLDSISKQYQKLTGDEDGGMFDLLKKATDDEFEALVGSLQEYATTTGIGIKDIRGLASNPALLKEVLSGSTERMKAQRETSLNEQMLRDFSAPTQAPQGTPTVPTALDTSSQPSPSQGAPGQPQGQSGGIPYLRTPEGQKLQQHVIQRATELGLDPVKVQALIHQESAWNPLAKSPTGVVGLMQVTQATGNQYGQDPTQRTNPYESAKAGLNYLAALVKKHGGDYAKAFMEYNGGSDPNYVQNVMRHEKHYTNTGSNTTGTARPSSQAVQSQATDADMAAIQVQKQRIAEAQAKIDRLSKYVLAGNVGAQRTVTALQKERGDAQTELGRLESIYNEKSKPDEMSIRAAKDLGIDKPYQQWTAQERQAVAAHRDQYEINFNAQKEKAAQDATLPGKKELATAANQGNIITDPAKYRNTKATGPGDLYPVGMTQADIQRENRETPGKWVPVVPMSEKDETGMRSNLEGINAAARALKLLEDDNVAKLIGHMFSNPEGSYKVALQKVFGNKVPDKYIELGAEIADLTSSIRHARIGGAQTVQETGNLKPMLPDLSDADVRTVRTKLRVLHNKLAEGFNSALRGHQKRGRDVNPEWQEIALLEASPDSTSSATPTQADTSNPLAKWKKK